MSGKLGQDQSGDKKKLEYTLGILYLERSEIDKLYNLSLNMKKKYPNWYGTLYLLGVSNFSVGKFKEAEFYLKKSIIKNDENFLSHGALSLIYYNQGMIEDSLYHWQRAFDLNELGALKQINSTAAVVEILSKKGDKDSIKNARCILSLMKLNLIDIHKNRSYQEALSAYYKASGDTIN